MRRGRRRTFAADRGRARFAAAPKVMPIAPCGSARRPDPARNREYVRPNIESQVSERAPRTGRWRARVSRDRRTRRNVGSAPSAILCVSASSVVTLRRQSWTRRGRRRTGPADRSRARFAGLSHRLATAERGKRSLPIKPMMKSSPERSSPWQASRTLYA